MFKRVFIVAVMTAALVLQTPAGAWARDNGGGAGEGGRAPSVSAMTVLPILLNSNAQMRAVYIVLMMRKLTYIVQMNQGISRTSQSRDGIGGLFGSVFATTYNANHFVKSLEVGSVYRTGDGNVAVALKGERRLEDFDIIVFNGEYQYVPKGKAEVKQVDPGKLAALGTVPIINRMLLGEASALDVALATAPEQAESLTDVGVDMLEQIPQIRKLMIGKVYRGDNNTLLIVIPPAIVTERES
ncbi:hypothetical protein AAFN88_03645 [Pelagibius sp. CAU 1746]|uniref:hypothetical protein n=1 Tax=Pelagibius sp. CAU 1746 TaxID=3140370 RepID=UPI00325B2AC2